MGVLTTGAFGPLRTSMLVAANIGFELNLTNAALGTSDVDAPIAAIGLRKTALG